MASATELDRLVAEAEAHPVTGWDFSWLRGRVVTRPLPWDYEAILLEHACCSPDLLDIDTGGGEWLASLPHRPSRTVATEAWEPNAAVAEARLRPLAVGLVRVEAAPDNATQRVNDARGRLPFPDESFHLVTNRHGAFVAAEVARVLAPGGVFVTEQVGGSYDDFYELLALDPPPPAPRPWRLELAAEQVHAAGLEVLRSGEAEQRSAFADVGALVWYLKAVPWVIPGFAADTHRPRLAALHARIAADDPLVVRLPAFWLEARKRDGV